MISTMSFLLRSWTEADAGCDRDISREIYPEYREDPLHPAWFPAQQLGAPPESTLRYVAVESTTGDPLAYAALWELRPARYRFDLAVRPGWQRQGIGAQLFDRILGDVLALGATGLQARVRDDKPEALEFIQRRGFHESHRMGAYRIDFAQLAMRDSEDAIQQLRQRGIEVTNVAAIRENEADYVEKFHQLYSAAREGWEDPDPPQEPVAVPVPWAKSWLDEARMPEAFFIAKDAGRYIGFTSLWNIGTAVHPDCRGRGIATLLKRISLADAQARGYRGDTTSTASPAMQRVLEKLGFRRLWSEIRLLRELG